MARVLIIGGGPAGISAACRLAQAGIETVLIERTPRLGGRAASFRYSRMDEEIDYGVHILMRVCTEAIALLELIGAGDAVRFQPRLHVPMRHPGGRGAVYSTPLPGPLHLLPSLLTYAPLAWGERVRAALAGIALLVRAPREEETFGEWLAHHRQSRRAVARLWTPVAVAALNALPDAVSARAAWFVLSNGFFRAHGADMGLFTQPLSQVFGSAVRFLEDRGGRVIRGRGAEEILIAGGRATGVRLADGEVIEGDGVILAVSPDRVSSLVPADLRTDPSFAWLSRLRFSPIVNVHLWFDRAVMDEEFVIGVDSPVQAVFDVTRIQGGAGPRHIAISQSAASELMPLRDDEIVSRIVAALGALLPQVKHARLLDSLVVRHPRATFVPAPGTEALRPPSRTPISGLYLAGDYTSTGWPATIEGAVRSGRLAVQALLTDRR